MKKKIYMLSPYIHKEERDFVQEAFNANWVAPLGPNVEGFEQGLAEYTGADYCTALSSGTAAIHLAVKLLGIGPGDIVLCSSATFAASCNPVVYEGGKLVFIDSEPETWNMSPDALRRALKKYPEAKAVICVHLYGTPAKIEEISSICKEHDVKLIEDAAESLGASYHGVQTGNFGDYSAFSFNGNKIITTSCGGALVTHCREDAERAVFLSTQAREPVPWYEHKQIGYNYRMSNILAGIGRGQMMHLDSHIVKKKEIYTQYQQAFADLPIDMNPYEKGISEPNFWLSCLTVRRDSKVSPNDIFSALAQENIDSRPIWKPMHLQPVFAGTDFFPHFESEGLPVCEWMFERGACLPSDLNNTEEDMARIIKTVRQVFA